MSYDRGASLEVPKAPKLGTKPLIPEDEPDGELLPRIPDFKMSTFDFGFEADGDLVYDSQSPTPTQNKDPSALFIGTDGLKSAFNSPSKRTHSAKGYGNEAYAAHHTSPGKQAKFDRGKGNGMELHGNSGKGKGRNLTPYEAGEYADAFLDPMALSDPGFMITEDKGEWETYDSKM
ncbi:hypothetical protein V5O48_006193 [Marasmius crinis-equi]|uniref:Uncharacterized protein n=1 Tax=Marasmius crinis-equi TaxID=585013 RepID=A0ABR3FK58_9AGAR